MIIDVENHYVPVEVIGGQRAKETRMKNGAPMITLHEKMYQIDERLAEMDQAGIDMAVLSSPYALEADLETCRKINNALAKIQKDIPEKFVGLATAPVLTAEGLDEIRRATNDLDLRGIFIGSQINGLSLDAPEYRSLYQLAIELDLPIFVHPAISLQGYSMLEGWDLPRILGREYDLALALTRLIFSGILDEFPNFKLVFSHMGGGIGYLTERIEENLGVTNGDPKPWISFRPKLQRPFKDYLKQLYYNIAGYTGIRTIAGTLQTYIPANNMLFASDYPQDFFSGEQIKTFIEKLQPYFTSEEWEAMTATNARKLLRI